MFELLKFLQKRPSDRAIKMFKILFGLIFISATYYNLIHQWDNLNQNILWQDINSSTEIYIKYAILSLWVIPIIMWFSKICLLKKSHMRIAQILVWILLFYISSIIEESPDLEIDTLIWFMWIFPLIWGITWKCITSNCMKHKEKITKIRV